MSLSRISVNPTCPSHQNVDWDKSRILKTRRAHLFPRKKLVARRQSHNLFPMKSCTRREFGKLSLAALPAGFALGIGLNAAENARKPDSKVRGVQIGLNVPYSFGNGEMSAEDILKN